MAGPRSENACVKIFKFLCLKNCSVFLRGFLQPQAPKAIKGHPCYFIAVGVSPRLREGETDADGDEAVGILGPSF